MTEPDEDRAPGHHLEADERDIEAPDADAVEQAISANPAEEPAEVHRGLEVGEWDAVEQAYVVDLDDDYR
ncbi:MAG TPA: hypothetical protein VGJ53_19555 [Micromonosporaceae bacterium]